MALTCGLKVIKVVMSVFNFLFALCGIAVLGIGIWVIADTSTVNRLVSQPLDSQSSETTESNDLISAGAYILIAVGAITLLTGACGFFGVIKENACVLILYTSLVIAIIVTQVVGAILGAVYQKEIEAKLKDGLRQSLSRQYAGMPTKSMKQHPNIISALWNTVMVTYDCCGVNGLNDFTTDYSSYAKNWYDNHRNYSICYPLQEIIIKMNDGWSPINTSTLMKAPAACCKYSNKIFMMNSDWTSYPDHIKNRDCPLTLSDVNPKGCFRALKEQAYQYSTAIIVTGAVVAAVEVTDVVASILLIVAIRKEFQK